MIKVRVEYLMVHKSDVYTLSRVPCVGESVVLSKDDIDVVYDVISVFHLLNTDETAQIAAFIRVQ